MEHQPGEESACEKITLEMLLEGYQRANADAASELISRISPDLLRYFLAQQTSRSEAEDLLQNTWLRIHKARHTYRSGAPVLPWVFAIAKHVKVDAYRKRRRIQHHEIATEIVPEGPAAREPSRTESMTFDSLIANLPDSQREVLTMMKVNGLSLEEVARATSSTVGAVKQKASRAYAKLRMLLSNSEVWGAAGKEGTGAG
jgi:RNA polymerase sigma-70 factor (ECF subfamily)